MLARSTTQKTTNEICAKPVGHNFSIESTSYRSQNLWYIDIKKVRLIMTKPLKKIEQGAVSKMREAYKKIRETTISHELEEALKKKDESKEKAPKKVAKPFRDVELP